MTAPQIAKIMSISFYGLLDFSLDSTFLLLLPVSAEKMKYRSNPKTLEFGRMATLVITHKPSQHSKECF